MPDALYREAARAGIRIVDWPLPEPILGLYLRDDDELDTPVIVLSPLLHTRPALHRTVLAEELGHHHTSSGYCLALNRAQTYSDMIAASRAEHKALRWAALRLMPPAEFLAAIRCGLRVDELAEEFGVTHGLLLYRIGLAQRMQEIA